MCEIYDVNASPDQNCSILKYELTFPSKIYLRGIKSNGIPRRINASARPCTPIPIGLPMTHQLYIGRGKRNIIATIYKETKLSDKIIQTQNKKKILEKQQRDEFETISKRV
ncbi:hypothetical protein YC2023_033494 [Brassica napus]